MYDLLNFIELSNFTGGCKQTQLGAVFCPEGFEPWRAGFILQVTPLMVEVETARATRGKYKMYLRFKPMICEQIWQMNRSWRDY